jgi:hypothetical protein
LPVGPIGSGFRAFHKEHDGGVTASAVYFRKSMTCRL